MDRLRVGIIQGGAGRDYEASLRTARHIRSNFPEHHTPATILIDREGNWHLDGVPMPAEHIPKRVDILINALHGPYGGDGRFQQFLEGHAVPYSGSNAFGSGLAAHKDRVKGYLRSHGLRAPHGIVLLRETSLEENLQKIWNSVSGPWIIKPIYSTNSYGVRFVKERQDLPRALAQAFELFEEILLEEFVRGREVSVGIVENWRNEPLYALPPVEIEKSGMPVFEPHFKEFYRTAHRIPARLSDSEKERVQDVARMAHQALGLRHYSQMDAVIHPSGTVFIIEINTLPDLSEHSLFERSLKAVGSSMKDFLHHLVKLVHGRGSAIPEH